MKKNISEYAKNYLTKHATDEEKIHEFAEFLQNFFCNLDEDYADIATGFAAEIEDFTEEIDEEMIKEIVENLKQKDGTIVGAKWTMEDTESVAKQYDAKNKIQAIGKKYDALRFWLALNYVYATHYSPSRTINGYVDLAVDEYTNKNICFDTLIKKIFEKM